MLLWQDPADLPECQVVVGCGAGGGGGLTKGPTLSESTIILPGNDKSSEPTNPAVG